MAVEVFPGDTKIEMNLAMCPMMISYLFVMILHPHVVVLCVFLISVSVFMHLPMSVCESLIALFVATRSGQARSAVLH